MKRSVRASLLSSTFFFLAATAAQAQGTGQSPQVETVTVTGSNIRGADLAPVVNLVTIDNDQLSQSGASLMEDVIKEIPSNAGTTQYNENGQLYGTAQFELRGLGFSSTLVLLNGRRAGVAPLSDKSGANFVDINQFPLAMVDHIDVLKDGSSAIYGSEAVAGVVNIVTRKGFEGLELSTEYDTSTNQAYAVNLATGLDFSRGSFNLYATYYNQTGNFRSDFPWLIQRVGGNGNPAAGQLINNNGFPGTFSLATINAAGKPTAATGATTVPDPGCAAAGGIFPLNASGVPNTSTCDINFTNQVAVVPNEHRYQAFLEGTYDLSDKLSYFNETSFSRNDSFVNETAGGFSNGSAVGGLIYVPASAPFNLFIQDPANPKNIIAVNPANWNPAVDQAVAVVGNFRPQGPYISGQQQLTDTYIRTVNGLNYTFWHNWQAGISDEFAYAQFQQINPLSINATELNSLIASGQYNPFASSILTPTLVSPKNGTSIAGNSQAVINQIFYTSNLQRTTEENVVDATVSGPLWDLPSGTISVALGGQYRKEQLNYTPDTLTAAGLGSTSTTDAPFIGNEQVWSEYAEAIIPVYDFAQIQAAIRHEDYGRGIGDTTNPKITGRANLFDGILGLRATWGTSFQAPTLTQEGTSEILEILNDPVVQTASGTSVCSTNTGTGTTVITTGGNLKPQTSRNYDFGADVKPIDGLNLTADYWHYNYTNLIAAGENAQAIVSGECSGGAFTADPRVMRLPNGLLSTVTSPFVNVGRVTTDGVDLSATYSLATDDYGMLKARLDATYLDAFDVVGANGIVAHDVGSRNFTNNFAPMPAWRGSAHTVWNLGIHEISLGVNLIGAYRNDQSPTNATIPSFTTVDMQYALHLENFLDEDKGNATTFTVGMNNAFDVDPPGLTDPSAIGGYDRPGYDALSGANIQGREVYIRLKQKF